MSDSESKPIEVREATLPGIGKKYVMPLRNGGNVAIIVRPDGERQLFHFQPDEDRPSDVVKLERDEAQQVANLLGAAMVGAPELDKLELVMGALEIEWVGLDQDSAMVGHTLAESRLRQTTGASVVAVIRGDDAIPNPPIDTVFEAGDTLLLIGDDDQTDAARRLIEEGDKKADS
ncbi:MAG: TrkA C-terminal domain-containing protein [Trueperaceae bacterium]|nr:TrkA C-terminal domain-containing protein [Trueperaceae bacterium]